MPKMHDDYNYYPPLSEMKRQPLDEDGRTRFERMFDEWIMAKQEEEMIERVPNEP